MNSGRLRARSSGLPWFFAVLIFCLQALVVSELDFAAGIVFFYLPMDNSAVAFFFLKN